MPSEAVQGHKEDGDTTQPTNSDAPMTPRPAATPNTSTQRSIFSIPPPIKRLFSHFPLITYPVNDLPLSAPRNCTENILYIFTTPSDSTAGAPSFNPSCLKWQTLLKIYDIPFATRPSNNHASPSGSLPFLVPGAQPDPSRPPPATIPLIPSTLPPWIRSQSVQPARALSNPLHDALLHPLRLAYLHALYLTPRAWAQHLYVDSASRNRIVRDVLAWQLRNAAFEEVTGGSDALWPVVDEEALYEEAEEALEGLSVVLGEGRWFGRRKIEDTDGKEAEREDARGQEEEQEEGEECPGMLDAAVFSSTYVILELFENGAAGERLYGALKRQQNLVWHRQRILDTYFRGH